MKPSKELGIVGTLDTVAECKVIRDALEAGKIPQPAPTPGEDEFKDSLGVRFYHQTQHEPRPVAASAYTEPVFYNNPEFQVRYSDVEFVLAAAKAVVREKNPIYRLTNRLSRRTQAAKDILRFLSQSR